MAKRQELLENIFFHFPTHAIVSIITCWIALLLPINDWPVSSTVQIAEFFPFSFFICFLLLNLGIRYFFPVRICFSHLQIIDFIYVVVSKGSQTQCLLSICVRVCVPYFLLVMMIMMVINCSPLAQVPNLVQASSKGIADCREQDKLPTP